MSYILDALRKSESERRQGRVPDLGQQVQLVHKPKKRSSTVALWIGIGLILNAVVLAVVFWQPPQTFTATDQPEPASKSMPIESEPAPRPEAQPVAEPAPERESEPEAVRPVEPEPETSVVPSDRPVPRERPTIIVPSPALSGQSQPTGETATGSQVPHLLEMPLAFQRALPDLVFNSHIYASEPSSRRVMINSHYLKAGDSFDGIRVQTITEDGVVLSKDGRSFRVGIVSNWTSPD
ncbi:general secretion pathway protein GspB [Marinobacter halotolerans]|uniref:general secretion pathway protein GspB n=1 Tax=Marinobacter halotolerans TaxID=1569211 RepID=UPI0012444958|nr:general secretion pathway protein GspB [Marinobacter halotolerans]